MKTITTTINWRNAAEELPKESCEVLVWRSSSNSVMLVQYSASHGRFNCCDFCSKELAARVAIAVDYWCYLYEIQMALTTFPEEKPLHGKFELARGKKKIKFREEAEKEEAEKNAFAKALKERFADLVSEKSQTGGESVIKMTNEEAIKILKVNAVLSPKATEFCEAVKIAVAAIERQIPKKPKPISVPAPFETGDYECPICGNPYIDDTYCSCCGQRLEW